jgi:hypothetical protein
MMSSDYVVRPYHPGDEEGIVELLELAFNGWPHFDLKCTPLDHWRWKHNDNPNGKSIISVAVSDDRIIGCVHSIPKMIKIRDKIYLCCDVGDVAVHPDFRGLGIYNKIDDLKYELLTRANVYLAYGVSGNPIVIRRGTKVGWLYFPHTVLNLFRIRDINLQLKMKPTEYAWLKKYGYHFLIAVNRIRNFHIHQPASISKFHIDEIDRYDDRINVFWDKIKDFYNFIIVDIKKYLNWRYYDTRGGEYIVKKVELDEVSLGYSVLRINRYRKEYPAGYIVDLLTLPNHIDAANALFADAIQYFDDQGVNAVSYWVVKNHPYEKIIKRYGFLDSRLKVHMSYDPLGKDGELDMIRRTPANRIHFAYGNTDAI